MALYVAYNLNPEETEEQVNTRLLSNVNFLQHHSIEVHKIEVNPIGNESIAMPN